MPLSGRSPAVRDPVKRGNLTFKTQSCARSSRFVISNCLVVSRLRLKKKCALHIDIGRPPAAMTSALYLRQALGRFQETVEQSKRRCGITVTPFLFSRSLKRDFELREWDDQEWRVCSADFCITCEPDTGDEPQILPNRECDPRRHRNEFHGSDIIISIG